MNYSNNFKDKGRIYFFIIKGIQRNSQSLRNVYTNQPPVNYPPYISQQAYAPYYYYYPPPPSYPQVNNNPAVYLQPNSVNMYPTATPLSNLQEPTANRNLIATNVPSGNTNATVVSNQEKDPF